MTMHSQKVVVLKIGGRALEPVPAVAGGFPAAKGVTQASAVPAVAALAADLASIGAPVVIGPYVFFSTLEKRTYALRVEDGEIAWRLPLGKYTPGIATERTYVLSLNGRLIATPGRDAPKPSG